jgi:hypothetical protein
MPETIVDFAMSDFIHDIAPLALRDRLVAPTTSFARGSGDNFQMRVLIYTKNTKRIHSFSRLK